MRADANRDVKVLLVSLAIAAMCTLAVMSCGSGGGGGSDGGLCSQCGDTDGPCLGPITIPSGDRTPAFVCPSPPCQVFLACARKLDSAQRRCFPAKVEDQLNSLDLAFECDGARPNPNSATPKPSDTPTPSSTAPTPTPTITATI